MQYANPISLLLLISDRRGALRFVSTLVSPSVIHYFLTLALRLDLLSYIALQLYCLCDTMFCMLTTAHVRLVTLCVQCSSGYS